MVNYESIIREKRDKASEVALARFISEVDTLDTKIGEFREGSKIGPKYLKVTGIMMGEMEHDISDILMDANMTLDMSSKFKDIGDKTSVMIMNDYIEDFKPENGEELLEKLRDIVSNKKVIMPIKVKTYCQVTLESNDKTKLIKRNTRVYALKWSVNPETSLMESYVLTEPVDTLTNKRAVVNITDYCKKLTLIDIERSCSDANVKSKDIIEMNRFCIIKPIRFKGKKMNFVIDNSFLYYVDNGSLVPIAYWDSRDKLVGKEVFNEVTKTKDYKEVKKYLAYIEKHRKYIGPALMVDEKVIELYK